jgi:DNA-directed RNA polymerase subunit RPC12/RpoP
VEVAIDEARFDEVGEAYCEDCYSERYTACAECGQEVSWDEVEESDGLHYCPSCYASLLDSSEEEEEAALGE